MASLDLFTFGETPIPSAKLNKLVGALNGAENIPIAHLINDAVQWALTLRNSDATNGRALIIYAADGVTPLLQVDKNGVKASPDGVAAATAVAPAATAATLAGAQALTNKTFDGSSNVMVRIAELGGAAASYDFQSIPQTYRHLELVVYGRSDTAAVQTQLRMRLQNVSTASYYDELLQANGAAVASSEALAATSARVGIIAAATAPATLMGTARILIPHYTQGNKEKPYTSTFAWLAGLTTGLVQLGQVGGVLDSAAAIDRVTVFPLAGSFVADSICSLYGLPR